MRWSLCLFLIPLVKVQNLDKGPELIVIVFMNTLGLLIASSIS